MNTNFLTTMLNKECLYQYFPDLGHQVNFKKSKTHSNSPEKLKCLNLPSLRNKVILDLGCNWGFFAINAALKGAQYVTGVDSNIRNINGAVNVAANYNLYLQSKIYFQCDTIENFFDKNELKYNMVFCLSVLHYIEDKGSFFEKVYNLLVDKGLLIIELPIFQDNSILPKTKKIISDKNFPTQFICNEPRLIQLFQKYFKLVYSGESNLKHRKVYHLRKRDIL